MDNSQLASLLNEICTLMELAGEDSFRSGAFARAARTIETLPDSVAARGGEGTVGTAAVAGKSRRDTGMHMV